MGAIRVLRVIARMNVGGPALQVTALTEGLDPERFEQRLLVGGVGHGEADYLELRAPHLPAERVHGLGPSPSPLGDLRALATIRRAIREFRPHVVHTHTAKAGVLGRTAAMLTQAPVRVHTFHGHLLHGYFSPLVTRGVVAVERVFARRTTRLVAVGGRVRDELLAAKIGRPEQYVVVPPGIELPPAPTRIEARARLGLPADASVVAFVARLTNVKRPDRFAEVATRVAAARPGTFFVIAGEGELLDDLRQRLGDLGDYGRFLGWRADVETVYAAADVVVLTSDNEGMPVSLIEAAMVGCPAVTTRVGSTDEVVLDGKTGFVVDVDAGALAARTLHILEDAALRERLAQAASAHARSHFSRARLIGDTATLYEAIVGTEVGS
jgi:glycosyltransferase involved in cell wall biosynthesis